MKTILAVTVGVMLASAGSRAAEPFPVPTSGNDIRAAYQAPENHVGRVVGLGGMIREIKNGPHGKPLVQVVLPKPNDAGTTIWIGLLVKPKPGQVRNGEIIRVLGYLAKVDADDTLTAYVVHDPLFVLGMCLVIQSTKEGLYSPEASRQCAEWQNGAAPGSLSKMSGRGHR